MSHASMLIVSIEFRAAMGLNNTHLSALVSMIRHPWQMYGCRSAT